MSSRQDPLKAAKWAARPERGRSGADETDF
jgi:hypothetical protein